MTFENLIAEIENNKDPSRKITSDEITTAQAENYLNSLPNPEAFNMVCAVCGIELSRPEDLVFLDALLQINAEGRKSLLSNQEVYGPYIWRTISEDAFCLTFDEKLVREALYRGFYTMSVQIQGFNLLSVRYHTKKCIIFPQTFRIPHNIKKLIEDRFSEYRLTFNKDYSRCVKELCNTYPDSWLCPKLTEVLENIHNNPDSRVSVDSVEIWKGDQLVAGEIGFVTGNAYASLSGFHKEDDIGNVQMALLGRFLFDKGFAYWDLGMSIPYKYRYGAVDCNRKDQEKFWKTLKEDRIAFPEGEIPLKNFLSSDLSSKKETVIPDLIFPFPRPGERYFEYGNQIVDITEELTLQQLYSAYMQGVFPWYCEDNKEPVTWYSPDPRFVLFPKDFHCPKSLRKFMKKTPYTYTMDQCFGRVMEECRKMERTGQDGTWIGKNLQNVYTKLHKSGYAHSFEVWNKGRLVGGFYGVLIGSVFFGESMFTLESNSSKSAFAFFMEAFTKCGGTLVDCQSYTENLDRYGAVNISRKEFLQIEKTALHTPLQGDLKTTFLALTKKFL